VSKKKFGKTDARYWKSRLFRNTYGHGSARGETADWCIKLKHLGRRETINLRTGNAEAAAAKAREFYRTLVSGGWDAALATYKPRVAAAAATIGPVTVRDIILASDQRAVHVRATTLRDYQGSLRQIAADLADLERPVDRHDYVNGGSARWREKVEALPLSIITPEALRRWQTTYVKSRDTTPAAARSAKVSANTTLGSAARLFTPIMLAHYKDAGIAVTENPFSEVKRFPKQDCRYSSKIDPDEVLNAAYQKLYVGAPCLSSRLTGVALANAKLTIADGPQVYRVILLGTLTGLRRSELDRLQWAHINYSRPTLTVLNTDDGDVKAAGSTRDVDLEADLVATLREWQSCARSRYVIECQEYPARKAAKGATYRRYRCSRIFDKAADWLRTNFLPGENHPIHTLRKEYGSLITQRDGIHAAAELLGHRDIRTASEYYVMRKSRAVTGLAVPSAPVPAGPSVPEEQSERAETL
jgi:integrase